MVFREEQRQCGGRVHVFQLEWCLAGEAPAEGRCAVVTLQGERDRQPAQVTLNRAQGNREASVTELFEQDRGCNTLMLGGDQA